MNKFFNIDKRILNLAEKAEKSVEPQFKKIAETTRYNQQKVLAAFIKNGVSESHFAPSSGYGYDDRGRECLEKVFADVFGAEDALVRHNFMSGTHTLSVMLFGVLRPGDKMLCLTGEPYDTLKGVIGAWGQSDGSLVDFGIGYDEVPLTDGKPDLPKIEEKLKNGNYKVAYIQRSRGYSLRPSLTVNEIENIIKTVRRASPDSIVMVDNCYGEFVERKEPTEVGADIMAGSLIKNPGGGIAQTGGYIVGRSELVAKCANRLSCAGVGREIGATLGHTKEMFMGFFNAPHITGEALKTAVFAAKLFKDLGFSVTPEYDANRADIVQSLLLNNEKTLTSFIVGMQSGAPIDSFVVPEAWDMPGYENKVIMAAGAFNLGASIELSADAPIRPPYAAYMQGGLNFDSAEIGVLLGIQKMLDMGTISL